MNKLYYLIIFLSFSFNSTNIDFLFFDSESKKAVNPKDYKVEYYITIDNQRDNEELIEMKPRSRNNRILSDSLSLNKIKYYRYPINFDFNKYIGKEPCLNENDHTIAINFKVTDKNKKNNTIYSGTQYLKSDFWSGCTDIRPYKTKGQDINLNPFGNDRETYFRTSSIIKDGTTDKEGTVILISLKPPLLNITGNILNRNISSTDKDIIDNVIIQLSKKSQRKLIISKHPEYRNGKFSIQLRYKIDNIPTINESFYLHLIAEDYYSEYIEIENENLMSGNDQVTNTTMQSRNPTNWKKTYNLNKFSNNLINYNKDCMEWACEDDMSTSEVNESTTHIPIPHFGRCIEPCGDMEDGQIKKNEITGEEEWVCIDDPEKLISGSNNTKNRFGNNDMINFNFNPFNRQNNNEPEHNNSFLEDFIKKYTQDCKWNEDFFNFIIQGFCNEDNKKDIVPELHRQYFFLIEASDAIYKIIRTNVDDNYLQKLLNEKNDNLNIIEYLIMIYENNKNIYGQASNKKTLQNYYRYEMPDPLFHTTRANHYMQIIDFYYWLAESLYYIKNNYRIDKKNVELKLPSKDKTYIHEFDDFCNDDDIIDYESYDLSKSSLLNEILDNLLTTIDEYKEIENQAYQTEKFTSNAQKVSEVRKKAIMMLRDL